MPRTASPDRRIMLPITAVVLAAGVAAALLL
jgi:hypothetical protein